MARNDFVPRDRQGERFKELGYSVFMTSARVGLAQLEVVARAKRLTDTWFDSRLGNRRSESELRRDLASLADAVEKLKEAEKK